jgi:Spx/MgsR family transcriptional regulator
MYKLCGIPNCNTVKKAMNHLESSGIEYEFVNFKKQAPKKSDIVAWKKEFGDWPANKKGPTFRKIKDEFEAGDANVKKELLITNSSAIKRPILEKNGIAIHFGYDEDFYNTIK